MRNAFQPLKKQFYVARKLDFQDSPKRGLEADEQYSPKKRITISNNDESSDMQSSLRQKMSLPAPRSIMSTKDDSAFLQHAEQSIKSGPYNVFQEINQAERKKYIDYNIGPRYDAEGNIGDQFQRVQQLKKKGVQAGPSVVNPIKKTAKLQPAISRNMSIREDLEDSTKITKSLATLQQQNTQSVPILAHQQSSSSDVRLQTATSQKIQGQKGVSKKHRNETKLIPKQDLLVYMQNVRKRVDSNERLESLASEKMAINMRNLITREKRVIERFDHQVDEWEDQRNIVSSQCNRESKTALMSRAEEFRRRVENVSGVEITKSDQEKYSNRFWYLRLRSYQAKSVNTLSAKNHEADEEQSQKRQQFQQPIRSQFDLTTSVHHKEVPRVDSRMQNRFVHDRENEQLFRSQEFIMADIFSGFQTKVVDNPSQQVEIVRKPILGKDQSAPLFSNKFHSLFEARMKEYPQPLRKKKANIDESAQLLLEGQSIFHKELKQLQNDGAPMMAFYKKLDIDKDPTNDDASKKFAEDEVIVEKWDMRTLSRTGEHFYPQLARMKK